MKCPNCPSTDATEIADEVDIGVGVQKFVRGYDCPSCGQVSICPACGSANGDHANYCDANLGESMAQ